MVSSLQFGLSRNQAEHCTLETPSPHKRKRTTVMKKSWMFLLTLIALGLVALVAMNARASDDENQLIQLERAWNQAEAGANPAAIVSLFVETLVYVDYDGSLMSKAEYL